MEIFIATVFTVHTLHEVLQFAGFSQSRICALCFLCQQVRRHHRHALLNSDVLLGLKKLLRTLMMCLLHPIEDGDDSLSEPRLLEVTGVQLSPSGSTGSPLLASMPSSLASLPSLFSQSSDSDSAELDSSSDSSLFPNNPLSGLGAGEIQRTVVVSLSGFPRFFRKDICLLLQKLPSFLPTNIHMRSSFSSPMRVCNPRREHSSTTCFKGVSLSHPSHMVLNMT